MKIFCTDFDRLSTSIQGKYEEIDIRRVYTKPDSALLNSGKMLYRPESVSRLYAGPYLIVRMARVGKYVAPQFAERYWGQVGVGVSFCGLDEARRAVSEGLPHVAYSGFDGSLVHSVLKDYHTYASGALSFIKDTEKYPLTLPPPTLINNYLSLISEYFMLKIGDLLIFPLLPDYIPVEIGDNLYVALGDEEVAFVGVR